MRILYKKNQINVMYVQYSSLYTNIKKDAKGRLNVSSVYGYVHKMAESKRENEKTIASMWLYSVYICGCGCVLHTYADESNSEN